MSRTICLMLALTLCFFSSRCAQAENSDDPNNEDGKVVTIELTKLDVNDTILELSWKIVNNSDHDVWICDNYVDRFMNKDNKTLVIRRRFDLPVRKGLILERGWGRSRYVRLSPGQEKPEFFSLSLPVQPYQIFTGESGIAQYTERLALEISFYDEDLPRLILEIVEIADHINCDLSVGYFGFRTDVSNRFFGGPMIALLFKHLLDFESNVELAYDDGEMWMPHMDGVHMGEQVLRLMVDGVSIPLK